MELNELYFSKYNSAKNDGNNLISLVELSGKFQSLDEASIELMWSELIMKMNLLLNKAEASTQNRQLEECELDHIKLIEHFLAMRNYLILLQQSYSDVHLGHSNNGGIFNKDKQQILFQQVISEISVTYCNLGVCLHEMNDKLINKQTHAFLIALQYKQDNKYALNNVFICMDYANSFYSAKYINRKRSAQYEEWAKYESTGYDLLKTPFPPGTPYRNWEGAVNSYKKAIRICPQEASSYYGLGLASYGLGVATNDDDKKYDGIVSWLKVIELQPEYDFGSRGFVKLFD